ncbi:Uncharacterized protein FWK35_00033034, partial [Aphis craccivora]
MFVILIVHSAPCLYHSFTTSLHTYNNILRCIEKREDWVLSINIVYEIVRPVPSLDNSERSEECIDFTMMCVLFFFFFFFVSVYSITSRNNAPISNYGGGFR